MSLGSRDEPPIRVRNINGTAASMWRCFTCGEMGRLSETVPDACPSCRAPREELYYWIED